MPAASRGTAFLRRVDASSRYNEALRRGVASRQPSSCLTLNLTLNETWRVGPQATSARSYAKMKGSHKNARRSCEVSCRNLGTRSTTVESCRLLKQEATSCPRHATTPWHASSRRVEAWHGEAWRGTGRGIESRQRGMRYAMRRQRGGAPDRAAGRATGRRV